MTLSSAQPEDSNNYIRVWIGPDNATRRNFNELFLRFVLLLMLMSLDSHGMVKLQILNKLMAVYVSVIATFKGQPIGQQLNVLFCD